MDLYAVGAGNSRNPSVSLSYPGNHAPVAEAQDELHPHRHVSAFAPHDAHEGRGAIARAHEIHDDHGASGGLVACLEYRCSGPVGSADGACGPSWAQHPSTVFRPAEQRRKARIRVEARQAEPVDRPIPRDEGSAMAVADEGVVLKSGRGHGRTRTTRLVLELSRTVDAQP